MTNQTKEGCPQNPKPSIQPRTPEFLKAQAQTISEFLQALFGPDEDVWIFPGLPKERLQAVKDSRAIMPKFLHGKTLTFCKAEAIDVTPYAFVTPFKRRASSVGINQLAKLWDFADLGYEIFFCVNPLTAPRRRQKTVRQAFNVVIESDKTDMETQRRIIDENRSIIRAALFTGGKSIHAYVHLKPEPWNKNRVSFEEASKLKKSEYKCEFPEFITAANRIIETFREKGLVVDLSPARDWTRVSRLPGFPHGKTGNPSQVLWVNPESSYDIDDIVHGYDFDQWLEDDEDNYASLCDPKVMPIVDLISKEPLSSKPSARKVHKASKGSGEERREEKKSITTIVKHNQSFLDHLETFERLKTEGIKTRGERRSYQWSILTTGWIMGWSEARMSEEWKSILSIGTPKIGCSVERAVKDFESVVHRRNAANVFYPNLRVIPDVDLALSPKRLQSQIYLIPEGIPEQKNIVRLLTKVVLPKVRMLPHEAKTGELNLTAAEMNLVCIRGKYRSALDWLLENRFLTMTKEYAFKRRARAYRVNVPLVLYLLGFKTGNLEWQNEAKPTAGDGVHRIAA